MTRVSLLLLRLFISTIFLLKCSSVNGLRFASFYLKNKSTYKEICEILFEEQTTCFIYKKICVLQITSIHKNGNEIADLINIAKGIRKWNTTIDTFKQVIDIFSSKKWPSGAAEKLLAVHSPYQIENINKILDTEPWSFWQNYFDTEGFAESFGLYISMLDFINNKNIYLNDVNQYRDWYEEKINNEREPSNALDKNLFGCDYEQLKVMSDFFGKSSITSKEEKYKVFDAVCHEGKIKWKSFILKDLLIVNYMERTMDLKTLQHALKYGYETLKEICSKKNNQLDWNVYDITGYLSSCYQYTDRENCVKIRFQLVLKSIKIFMKKSTFLEMIRSNSSFIDDQGLSQIITFMDFYGFFFSDNSNLESLKLSYKIMTNFINIYKSETIEEREMLISFVLYNAMDREWNKEDLSVFLDKTINKYNFVSYDYYKFFEVVEIINVNEVLGIIEFFSKLDKHPAVYYEYSYENIKVKNNLMLLLDDTSEKKLNRKIVLLKKYPKLYKYPMKLKHGCSIKLISSVVNYYLKTSKINTPVSKEISDIYDKICINNEKEDTFYRTIETASLYRETIAYLLEDLSYKPELYKK